MRPLITILLITALMGGIFSYARFAESVRPKPPEFMMQRAAGEYTVRVTRTFDSVGNKEFGFQALEILFKTQVVYSRDDKLPASEIITIPPLIDVEEGENEIVVRANTKPPMDFENLDESQIFEVDDTPLVMRIEILRDGNQIAETSIWNEPGIEMVQGAIGFSVVKSKQEEHDH